MSQREQLELSDGINGILDYTPFYQNAFNQDYNNTWGHIDYYGLNARASEWSYKRLLSCFIRDGRNAELNRRLAMFYYLANSGFSSREPLSIIRLWFKTITCDNSTVKRIAANLGQLYIYEPQRSFKVSENDVNESDLNNIKEVLDKANFNNIMKKIHQHIKITGEMCIHPIIKNNRIQLELLYPDEYQSVYDEHGILLEIWIPFQSNIYDVSTKKYQLEQYYEVWDFEEKYILDVNKNRVDFNLEYFKFDKTTNDYTIREVQTTNSMKHPYKRVPYFIINYNPNNSNDYENEDGIEVIKKQMEANMIDLLSREDITKAFQLMILVNFGIKRGEDALKYMQHGGILPANNVKEQEGSEVAPYAQTAGITPFFSDMAEFGLRVQKESMKNAGLPSSLINDNPGIAESGEAMKMDRKELDEQRINDIYFMGLIEKETINLLLLVANNDGSSPYVGKFKKYINNLDVSIDFSELSVLNHEQQVAFMESRKNNGTVTVLEYTNFYANNNALKTKEDAIKYINENMNDFQQIKGMNDGNSSTEDRPESNIGLTKQTTTNRQSSTDGKNDEQPIKPDERTNDNSK